MLVKNIISNTRHKLGIKSHILSSIKSQIYISIIIQYKILQHMLIKFKEVF